MNVWYPAVQDPGRKQMTFGAYVDQIAPDAFSPLNTIMKQRNRENAEGAVGSSHLPALLSTPMFAFEDLPAPGGRFPTVLYFGGLNADVNSNVIMAEFLASHGYVVVSVSLLGITDQQPSESRTPSDLDAVVRDMEFFLPALAESGSADITRLAVMGHSLGAIQAAMLALRNGNVSAAVGLDGTYGFKGSSEVLTRAYGFDPKKMRAAFLDLRRAQGEQEADLDLAPVLSFRYADRTLVALTKMHHSDFTSFAMVAYKFQVPIRAVYAATAWNRQSAQRGHQETCRIVLEFLNQKLKGDSLAGDRLQKTIGSLEGSSLQHLDALPPPPSPAETVTLTRNSRLDDVRSLFTRSCRDEPVAACVDADLFNTYGYDLLAQNRPSDALVVLELVAWAHPTSANAQDSLADGYLAIGDKERARKAIQRAIEMAPGDPAIGAGSKASFIANENRRLDELK